ncbi:hypothetical protein TRFO_17092 [Tritrichomonas foetus]|uniref:Guanylate cyclase domain-containing protein n=1 Tax=Tritrichomonas foetus TaxID=1144522 RepID=A0A1J4KT21_9EUKA|nr:hypothetical protein TRFO_17092 [Tritrichomonas foetus]|eukprot:OHT12932.1 hypothetical protein TRFO_17092 [Tritrichomonas foetus]
MLPFVSDHLPEPNLYDGGDEIETVDKELEFASILYIPLHTKIKSALHSYFSKIHATVSAPPIVGIFYLIMISIQSFFPQFLIDCPELWPEEDFLTSAFRVLSYLWVGPTAYDSLHNRVIMSFVFDLIFIAAIIVVIWRSRIYVKTLRLRNIEAWSIYIIYKFLLPSMLPHLIVGIPLATRNLIEHYYAVVDVLCIILSSILFCFYLYLIYTIIVPRVLLEDIPTHEWLPILAGASLINSSLLCFTSSVTACIYNHKKAFASIWMAIQSLTCGVFVFRFSATPKRITSVIIATVAITGSFIAVIQSINILIEESIEPLYVILFGVAIFVCVYIILHFINKKKILRNLEFFDQCLISHDSVRELMEQRITSPIIFLGLIRSTMEFCHPFFLSLVPFDYALNQWPDNSTLLLFYARVLSFFPNRNSSMTYIATLLSKHKSSASYVSYLRQFRHISRTRQAYLTPNIKRQLDEIHTQCESLNVIIRRFWENILQKNTSSFWEEAYKINNKTKEIESYLQQMSDDYPNNETVLKEQMKFILKIKRDFVEFNSMKKKLDKLRKDGYAKFDIALSIVLKVFPSFNAVSEVVEPFKNDSIATIISKTEDTTFDESNDYHIELGVQQITKKSKLGRIWVGILVLFFTTCICITLYVIYHMEYKIYFLRRELDAITFLNVLNRFEYELNTIMFLISLFPMTFPGFPASLPDDFMEKVAPTLYPDYVFPLSLSREKIEDKLGFFGDYIGSISEWLTKLDQNNQEVIDLNNLFLNTIIIDNYSMKNLIHQIVLKGYDVLMYQDPAEYFNSQSYQQITQYHFALSDIFINFSTIALSYSSTAEINKLSNLSEKLVLSILSILFFVTLPFILLLFKLQIQSNLIAESFSFIPNTEIRRIINEFGKLTSKTNEYTSAISLLSQNTSFRGIDLLWQILVFGLTFIPVLILGLGTFYEGTLFIKKANDISYKAYWSYKPFSQMITGIEFLMRIAQVDASSLYLPKFQTREMLVNITTEKLYEAADSFSIGMWGSIAGAKSYFTNYDNENVYRIYRFEDVFVNNSSQLPNRKSYFEQFATENLINSFDSILGYSLGYIAKHSYPDCPIVVNDDLLLSLLYWFDTFGPNDRTNVYFLIMRRYIKDELNYYESSEQIFLISAILFQIVSFFSMCAYLFSRHNSITGALRFYHFIRPCVLLNNHNAILLIENGKKSTDKNDKVFSHAEEILRMIGQGVIVIDSTLSIIDFNPAFASIVQEESIKGRQLNDLIYKDDEDSSWTYFIVHVNECLIGKKSPQFKENITGKLSDGQTIHFTCHVIALNDYGVLEEGDSAAISKIAIIFEDCTQMYMRQQIIDQEMNLTREVLLQEMPERLVNEYMNLDNAGIAFFCQSVSIGQLHIRCEKEFEREAESPFKFMEEIFSMFDKKIKEFPLLCKMRTYASTYVFIGGLFSEENRPDKHAEQACQFALSMISEVETISKDTGYNVEIVVGIHTGGPIVAGVMENLRPSLQIIGPVMEMATQMTVTGIEKHVQVTRSVYELVFSAGFHISERGDATIRGGEKVTTYLICPS